MNVTPVKYGSGFGGRLGKTTYKGQLVSERVIAIFNDGHLLDSA